MLRKIRSFGLLNRRDPDEQAPPSPSSLSSTSSTDTVTHAPRPRGYRNSTMEALHLEPIVAPFLAPMRDMTVTREDCMHPRGRRPGQSIGAHVREEMQRRPSAQVERATRNMGVALKGKIDLDSPRVERDNPFDDPSNPMQITPIPRRPGLRRNAVSARSRGDMPLRVQAIRRSHQQAFAEALARRIEEQEAASRRSSEDDANPEHLFVPSALWERRRRTSPEPDETPALRLQLFGEDPPPGTDQLFYLTLEDGQRQPYDLNAQVPAQNPALETVDPRGQQTPRGEPERYVYWSEDGRTWL